MSALCVYMILCPCMRRSIQMHKSTFTFILDGPTRSVSNMIHTFSHELSHGATYTRRGGGTQVQGRTRVTYFAEEGVFFKTSACPRFCKRRVLFCTQVRSMGVENPLTIHEIYAALTPSDSRSDWASEFPAAACRGL